MNKILFYFYLLLSSLGLSNVHEPMIINEAFECLNDIIYDNNEHIITENIDLPEYLIVDNNIVYLSYTTSNKDIITNEGVVNPSESDEVVTIYCKAECNNKNDIKVFFVKVPGKINIPIYCDMDEYFLGDLVEFSLPSEYDPEDFEWVVSDDSLVELDEDYLGYFMGVGEVTISIYKEGICYGSTTFEIMNKVPSMKLSKDIILIGEEFDVLLSNYKDSSLFNILIEDESILEYNNGKFIARGEGKTLITYELKADERTSKSIEVTVYDNVPQIKVFDNEMNVGSSIKIYVENYKNESDYNIEILNKELGAVDGNKINALKAGVLTVKVSLSKNPNIYSTIDINIVNVKPEAYVLSPNIIIGGKTYLSIKNIDKLVADDFEYINHNPEIIIIEGNVITGKSLGNAEITVKSKSMPELSCDVNLTVGKLTDVKLDDGEVGEGPLFVTLEGNKEKYMAGEKIKVNVLGAKNIENYKLITSDNELINTLEDGHIITKAEGRATVLAVNKNDNSIKGQVDIIIEGVQDVDYIERLIATAESQLGYRETSDGLTKYGIWYGIPDGAWCAMFVTWCAHNSGISTSVIPFYCGCTAGMKWFVDRNQFGYKENYIPKRGDIIFFLSDGAGHTGIVTGVSGNTVYTIEGNTSNMCARRQYPLDYSTITGYGIPNYE